jgi:hypothetical protein
MQLDDARIADDRVVTLLPSQERTIYEVRDDAAARAAKATADGGVEDDDDGIAPQPDIGAMHAAERERALQERVVALWKFSAVEKKSLEDVNGVVIRTRPAAAPAPGTSVALSLHPHFRSTFVATPAVMFCFSRSPVSIDVSRRRRRCTATRILFSSCSALGCACASGCA